MRLASFLYAVALLTLGAGPATKVFFGGAQITWFDPSLVLSMLAMIALLPHLNLKNTAIWRQFAGPLAALSIVCGLCVLSGLLLLPTGELYNALEQASLDVGDAGRARFWAARRQLMLGEGLHDG